MAASFVQDKDVDVAAMLKQAHEEIRAELARAEREPGPVGEAAKRLSALCLRHFEAEEKFVLPMLARLHHAAAGNDAGDETSDLVKELTHLSRRHREFGAQHESIASAAGALLETANRLGNREVAQLAQMVRSHEEFEDGLDLSGYESRIGRL